MAFYVVNTNEARSHWREIVDHASVGADVVIERHGKPIAAVILYEDYVALQKELEDLRAVRRAQAALDAWQRNRGGARPYSQVREKLVRVLQLLVAVALVIICGPAHLSKAADGIEQAATT
jgi:prevent-host-death family protein